MQSVLTELEQDQKVRTLNNALSAEERVAKVIEEESGFPVFLRKRVFVAQDNHNREIDVVCIADRILAIEVKNWTGSVWRNDYRWFQLPFRAQRPLEFEDIFAEARHKAEALKKHLENDHKILLQGEDGTPASKMVLPVLIFTHPQVKLDPNTIANMEGVFTLESFRAYIGSLPHAVKRSQQSWGEWMLSKVPQLWPTSMSRRQAMLPADVKDQVESALGKVRTWDTVTLHNGTLIHGDVVSIDCPSASSSYARHHIVNICLTWSTGGVVGLAGSLWNGTAGVVTLELVDAKRQGKRNESKPRDAQGNIVFPIIMPKAKTDMRNIDRIVVKRAGTPNGEPIPLSTIRSIELSQHVQIAPR